ncbi:MAG: putative ABC transport system ATP-binding protein [Phycisphaerales bacterium]|jgi:putative ABC transport system ATP-binding protein
MGCTVKCTSVFKSFRVAERAVEALRGLDLEIQGPGFFAIMGRSGSGKSTLLHLLGSLDRPDSGTIEIAGVSVHDLHERDAVEFRRKTVGIVFQGFNLIPTMTAQENVQLPGLLAGDTSSGLAKRAADLLDQLGLADRAHHRPEAMSGGEQQRVAIARALLYEPPVILADEPTGNLDSETSERLWELLGEVAKDHDTTVVMVTHEPEAAAHCQKITLVRDGRNVGTIDTEGLDASGVATHAQRALG